MESALLVKGKISNEVPSDTVSVSGNDYRGYSNGKDEPRYSLEQIQLILQRAQRHEIARETARTEQVQRSALENYLRTNLKTNDAVEGASLSTVYEVARQNMGLSNEDVDWALKNCAFSSERVRELLKANGIEDSKGCSQRKKNYQNNRRNRYFMKEFRKEILRETVSMLEEKIGGNFSRKVRTKLTVLGELLFIPLCNMLAVFDVLDSAAVLYKEATIYASREIQGKQKKSKIAKFDFEVSKYHEVTGQHLNVKIYSPIFLEVFKE